MDRVVGVLPGLVGVMDRGKADVPIELVGIGHERPQLLGGGAEPPFPPVAELWIAHLQSSLPVKFISNGPRLQKIWPTRYNATLRERFSVRGDDEKR